MMVLGPGSVEGGTGWYLVLLGQYGAELAQYVNCAAANSGADAGMYDASSEIYKLSTELIVTWWYWDRIGRYWLIYNGTGSVWSKTG